MKKQYTNDLKPGDVVEDIFILSEKAVAQKRDGNNYLNVTLSDKTGRIKGVVWDNVDRIAAASSSGDVVSIRGNVSEYRGIAQLVIKQMEACSPDEIDPAEFLPATRHNVDSMFERLLKIVDSLDDGHLKALLNSFWDDEAFVRQFKTAPAAKKMHHAYIGGLLEHTLSMTTLADKIAGHYSGTNRDLLIAGAILHDIGKTKELEYIFSLDYSDEGRFLSHIVIGLEMIEAKLAQIEDFPDQLKLLLKHMIVSHHGTQEFGSPEPPKTIEAVLLNYIDEMDSKVKAIRDFIASEDSNETWTSFHRLLGRHFYMGKKDKEPA
jgi:3'-5' exoribonuclease